MATINELIAEIREEIKENGRQEITGPVLQQVLLDMVYVFRDATPSFDSSTMWQLLGAATAEQINVSHLSPADVAGLLTQAGYKLTDTTYALATDAVAGLVMTGYAENGKNYAVKLDNAGRAYVTVNWQDKFDTYFGVDEDGNIYVKGNRGFWSNSFISARGSDPEAGSGGGGGLDVQAMWYALAQPTTEKINVSHIPAIGMDKVSGLADALADKLSGITGEMVTEALGYTPYDASRIGSASVKYAASAGKVAHALSIVAGDETAVYDGSAAKSVTVPTAEQIALWNKVGGLFDLDADGNVYVKDNRGFYGNSFISARGSDPGAGSGGGSGVDMDSVWYALGQPTTEKINVSHIPALQQLSGTLTNAQLANSSLSVAGVSVPLGGSVTTAQIASALTAAGYKLTDTIYTLPKATVSALGGIKAAGVRASAVTTAQGGTTSGRYYGVELDSNGKAFVNVPWVNTTYTLGSFGITATAAEINKLDGLATTAAELGYVHGVTSAIQTQLNAKANASALTAYALKDGSNASGTWGISISGTAADASALGGINSADYMSHFRQSGVNIDTYATLSPKIIEVSEAAGTKPLSTQWLQVMQWGSDDPAFGFQMAHQYASQGNLYFRQKASGTWGGWKTLLDSSNYATTLDTRYLLKSSYTASDILAKLKTVDGSGSGLDADLLDGYNIASVRLGVSDLVAQIGAAGWYRVYTSSTTNAQHHSSIILHIGRSYTSPQNEHYTFSISVGYNGDINITQLSGVIGGHLITKIRVVWANSQSYFIDIYTDYRKYTNWYSVYGQGYGAFSAFTAGATIPSGYSSYEFATVEGCKSDRGFIGSLYGNASSATKLATARSIWGQTFDGTQGVDGHLFLGSQDYRLYFGKSGVTSFLTCANGIFQLHKANNTSSQGALLAVNLSSENVGIGTTTPTDKLHVIGTIRATTGIWSDGYVSAKGQDTTSDARYKRDVAALPAQAALAVLMRLRPSTWSWRDDGRRGAGFVAQEVLGVLPEAVREVGRGEDRHLALNYQMLHAYEVCMLQTHETELERLRGRVNQLENEIKRIRHGA